jgi:HPt (histidine-containing phosphotransfer) domain-containing protein
LIGVARNVGATLIAQEARALETQIATDNPDLSSLRKAVDDTLAFIRRTGG